MSNRIKYILLILLLFCISIIIYLFVIKKTLVLYKISKDPKNSEAPIELYKQRQILLDKVQETSFKHNSKNISYDSYRIQLINYISTSYQNNPFEIIEIPKTEPIKMGDYEVTLDSLVIKGQYFNFLHLLKDLEFHNVNSKIIGCSIYALRNTEAKKNNLFMKIYIVFIKSNP